MTNDALVIQEKAQFSIDNFQLEVLSYLGQLAAGIHYFKVSIMDIDEATSDAPQSSKIGLLRIGSPEGGLGREQKVREVLSGYKMISELLAETVKDSVTINLISSGISQQIKPELDHNQLNLVADLAEPTLKSQAEAEEFGEEIKNQEANNIDKKTEDQIEEETSVASESVVKVAQDEFEDSAGEIENEEEIGTKNNLENSLEDSLGNSSSQSEYLEEEFYPDKEIDEQGSDRKLLLLSYLPEDETTLQSWLTAENSLESSLSKSIQVCQFFCHLYKQGWCFIQILPQFIEVEETPLKFFDLTGAYALNDQLSSGLLENYCAPELAVGKHPIQETMSTYTVGSLLYQAIHRQQLNIDSQFNIKINPIPRIYQLLKIALAPTPEERFSLAQFLSLLVENRKFLQTNKIYWQVASRSTTGLSPSRLQNEDSYGIRQVQLSNSETLILGVVADGMGGMSQGEVASKLAVATVLEESIPGEFKNIEQRSAWLVTLIQKANESVATHVRDGGTTLSVVLAVGKDLAIAHVGDSRVYLLRNGEVHQLSEDHSLVAMLVASGEITYEESLNHPDRNVLTKSIGSKKRLSDGYVQNKLNGSSSGLSICLEHGDILLLCSDGVWDLVPNQEIAQLFTNSQTLQAAVDAVIDCVLQRGAPDNATLLALELSCDPERY